MVCILVVRVSREILPVGYLKGRYKSESSLMTCEAELHGSVTRMVYSILSLMGRLGNPDSLFYPESHRCCNSLVIQCCRSIYHECEEYVAY